MPGILPAKLKNFLLFNAGNSYQGQVPEVSMPKLSLQTEEWRGGGMMAPVDVDMGLQKLVMEWKFGGLPVQILGQFGDARADGVQLRFVGAYQDDGTGAVQAAELVVRGRHTEIDGGTAKPGEGTEVSITSALTYLKWTVNGAMLVEVDVLNLIFVTGGVDRMAEIRLALGI